MKNEIKIRESLNLRDKNEIIDLYIELSKKLELIEQERTEAIGVLSSIFNKIKKHV